MSEERRERLRQALRSEFERTIEARIDRGVAIRHLWVMANHYFSEPTAECLALYRDGRFSGCVMMSQAISEAVVRSVAERNSIKQAPGESKQELVARLEKAGVVTSGFVQAFERVQRSHRNDFHHMNPPIAKIDIEGLARRNIEDLCAMQKEIFGFDIRDGMLVLNQPKYWDVAADGTVNVRVLGH